jgi:hypothetical protein
MKRTWKIFYYEDENGRSNIHDFIESQKERDQDFIILTHAFLKHTSKVPKKEINKARKCREDFLSRYDEKKLREISDEKL